ncbi:MAG TPA: short chain dehydrogenase [Polyangiaceae bacterium]
MNVIVIGRGTIGSAVKRVLEAHGHEVQVFARSGGERAVDITKVESLRSAFASVKKFDAVACCAGDVFPAPLEQATDDQWARSFASKAMGQIAVVRAALPFIADKGSFVLVSGVLTDEVMPGGVIGTTINHTVEGFVKGAAPELPRGIRINCVSPTIVTESTEFRPYFVGFEPVAADEVARAYLRAIANPMNGRIVKLHKC